MGILASSEWPDIRAHPSSGPEAALFAAFCALSMVLLAPLCGAITCSYRFLARVVWWEERCEVAVSFSAFPAFASIVPSLLPVTRGALFIPKIISIILFPVVGTFTFPLNSDGLYCEV